MHLHQGLDQREPDAEPGSWSGPASTWENISNRPGRCSGAMPVSASVTATSAPSRAALIAMVPPGSVYLTALSSRLAKICARRTGSASSPIAADGN
jgi:hypothetical protein